MTDLTKFDGMDDEFDFGKQNVLPDILVDAQKEKPYDQSWKAHRTTRVSENAIIWSIPQGKEDVALPSELVSGHPGHNVVAVRGIPLEFRYGFRLSEENNGKTVTHCYTTELYNRNTNTSEEDRYPLRFPVGQIHQSKRAPNQLNSVLLKKPHLELRGSRPPVGEPEGSVGIRTCESCVMANEHYIGTEAQFLQGQNIPVCRQDGYLIFCVFELGILDTSEVWEDAVNGRAKVKWVNIADAKIKNQQEGGTTFLDRPFILKIGGLTKTQHWAIGKGQYDRNVELPSDSNQSYLPNKVYSTGEYFDYLHDQRGYGTRSRTNKKGDLAFFQLTDMYVGKLATQQFGQSYMPVFTPVNDEEVINSIKDCSIEELVKTAMVVRKYEVSLVSGQADSFEFNNVLSGAAKTKALPDRADQPKEDPAKEVIEVTAQSAGLEPEDDMRTRQYQAFSPK